MSGAAKMPDPAPDRLHAWQRPAFDAALAAVRAKKRVILNMATGTGKTVVGMAVVAAALGRTGRVLWVTHTLETVTQAEREARTQLGIGWVGVVMAERNECDCRLTIATVQTISMPGRLSQILAHGDIALLVVDECHHARADSYELVIGALRGVPVFGLTATCERPDELPLGAVFRDGIAYTYNTLDAVADCNLVCPVPEQRAIPELLEVAKEADSLQDAGAEVREAVRQKCAEATAALVVERVQEGRVVLCFTVSVDQARRSASAAEARGISASYICAETPKSEREDIREAFEHGGVDAVFVCQALAEGFDNPWVDCIVIARRVLTLTTLLQLMGRGLRWRDDIDKIDCEVWDLVGSAHGVRHGDDLHRPWYLFLPEKSRAEETGGEREERERRERDAELDRLAAFLRSHGVELDQAALGRGLCGVPGCGRSLYMRGLCDAHRCRAKKGAPMAAPVELWKAASPVCAIDGCGRSHSAKGLCQLHYKRQRAGRIPMESPPLRVCGQDKQPCGVDGCDQRAKWKGLCVSHYNKRQGRRGGAA